MLSSAVRSIPADPLPYLASSRRENFVRARRSARRRLVFVVLFALVLIVVGSVTDHAGVGQFLLQLKALVAGSRVQSVFCGILLGFLIGQQRVTIAKGGRRLGRAVVGDSQNTAWALQGVVGIGLLAAIVFALKPDLLQYLKSLKLGEFEATFADRAPTASLREAHLNLKDFREQIAFHQYEKFKEKFLLSNTSRGWARALLNSSIQPQTNAITEKLAGYVDPVIGALLCLRKAHAVRSASKDWQLAAYAVAWEDFLLKLHADNSVADMSNVQAFLMQLTMHANGFVEHVKSLTQGCSAQTIDQPHLEDDAKVIADKYADAAKTMKDQQHGEPEILVVVAIDSYFTGAVSDLIALISGDREKTDFLIKMTKDFPLSEQLISPGIINLFYQATDAWLNTAGPIAVEDARANIEYATTGASMMMSLSASLIPDSERNKTNAPADCGKDDPRPQDHPEKMRNVYDTFLRNLFATLTSEADIFIQYRLNGGTLTESQHENWVNVVSRLSAMLQTRLNAPAMGLDNVPSTSLDDLTIRRLRKARISKCPQDEDTPPKDEKASKTGTNSDQALIDPDFMLQANLAVALSAVLLSREDAPTTSSCNAAQFYVNSAAQFIEDTKTDNELDDAQLRRLQQLVTAVGAQIGERCAWKPTEIKSASP